MFDMSKRSARNERLETCSSPPTGPERMAGRQGAATALLTALTRPQAQATGITAA
jgi:hypothetical protein